MQQIASLPHRAIKYSNGDVFRFEIGREHYGFGIIIGQIRKMQKDGIISARHAYNYIMGRPLLVRFYQIKTKDRDLPIAAITSSPLLPTEFMDDATVRRGGVDIVGNKRLQVEDIHLPMHAGRPLFVEVDCFCLCWGIGMITTEDKSKLPSMRNQEYSLGLDFYNINISFGVNVSIIERAMRDESARTYLCHPDNASFKEKVFRLFQLPLDISFDKFNSKHDGMTRQQYADYANKHLRPEKTATSNKSSHPSKKKG